MESKANYTLIGLLVILLTAALIISGIWLSVGFEHKKYHYYLVYMPESVSGLNEDSLVKYNGVKVGTVAKIELSQVDPQQVKILLKIVDGTPVTTATKATLITQGITGNTYLGLTASSASFTPLPLSPGEAYPVIPYKPSFFNQLEKNINAISLSVSRVMNKENADNFKTLIKELHEIAETIAKNDENINASLKELPAVLKEFESAAKGIKTMAGKMSASSLQVNTAMQSGKAAMDKVSQQVLPSLSLILRRVDRIAADLEAVSQAMRQNPAVIIRGTTPVKAGPGE